MPKFMIQVNYTADGARGLLKDGGSKRLAAAKGIIASVGGTLEAFYFTLGDTDAFVVADMPDAKAMARVSLTLAASGMLVGKSTALLSIEDMDDLVKTSVTFTPPGQ